MTHVRQAEEKWGKEQRLYIQHPWLLYENISFYGVTLKLSNQWDGATYIDYLNINPIIVFCAIFLQLQPPKSNRFTIMKNNRDTGSNRDSSKCFILCEDCHQIISILLLPHIPFCGKGSIHLSCVWRSKAHHVPYSNDEYNPLCFIETPPPSHVVPENKYLLFGIWLLCMPYSNSVQWHQCRYNYCTCWHGICHW